MTAKSAVLITPTNPTSAVKPKLTTAVTVISSPMLGHDATPVSVDIRFAVASDLAGSTSDVGRVIRPILGACELITALQHILSHGSQRMRFAKNTTRSAGERLEQLGAPRATA